jgi:single-strand DNA-binding protein
MASVNKVILLGHLGKDPDVRTLSDGAKVASFSIATTELYKDKQGQRVERTEWHNIVMWRGLAELAEKYLTKGNQIYLEGKIQTQKCYDKDGNKRQIVNIVVDTFIMLGGGKKKEEKETEKLNTETKQISAVTPGPDDDLPF